MTNCLFYALFFSIFMSFSIGGIRFSSVNRAFESMYKGVLESSAVYINENGEPANPYFIKDVLVEYVSSYLKENIKNEEYEARVYFFNDDELQSYCDSEYCSNVKITLKCDINIFFHFNKTKDFYLRENYGN